MIVASSAELVGISVVLPNGKRLRQSTGTENREEAQALLAKLKLESFREAHLGIKPKRSWQEAVVRYLEVKATLRSIRDVKRICRNLDPYLGDKMLTEITGDVVWSICQRERAKGNKPATVNRYLAVVRGVLSHGARRVAVDRQLSEDPAAAGRSGARPLVDAGGGRQADFSLRAAPCGDRPVCARDGMPSKRDHRPGVEPRRPGTPDGVAEPHQEWNAARRPVERGCGRRLRRREREAPALLLHVPRRADPVGRLQHRLARGGEESGADRFSLSRLAAHLGFLASAGRHELRRAEGAGWLEVAGDGGPLCEVRDGALGRGGFAHRSKQA